jgi:hypothetical protein
MELPIQNLLEQSERLFACALAKPLLNILQMAEESAVWKCPYRIYRSRAACFCPRRRRLLAEVAADPLLLRCVRFGRGEVL